MTITGRLDGRLRAPAPGLCPGGRTGGSSGKKRPFCDILSQLKLILMHSSALEPPCGARSYELDQKIPAVRRQYRLFIFPFENEARPTATVGPRS